MKEGIDGKKENNMGRQEGREKRRVTCFLTFKKHYFKLLREAAEGGPDTIYVGKMWQN